jgi:transcriptional regulator with XRE-family HTH domain
VTEYSREALGLVVRGMRERAGLTQEELGRKAGYGTGAGVSISRLEGGLLLPGAERFAGIADALGLSPAELEARAAEETADHAAASAQARAARRADGVPDESTASRSSARPKERAMRIQREVDERTRVITELTDAFNEQHDRARDEFFVPLAELASRLEAAQRLDVAQLGDEDAGGSPEGARGVLQPPSGVLGTAPTSSAVGRAAVWVGIVGAPSLILGAGGLLYLKRNRKQQQELAAKLDEAEAELAATRPGVEALQRVLASATEALDYLATHAGHAVTRWASQLDPGSTTWESLSRAERRRFEAFMAIAAAQVEIVTIIPINVQGLLTTRGSDRDHLIQLSDELLTESMDIIRAHV